ncbi:MAG: M56 family metallopeptidase [Clostridiales bacterium]|nr:M56 family metallopeptidase [Clostridiales bacterium]
MVITAFSFIMSIFWFNIFIIVIILMRKRTSIIVNFNIIPLLLLVLVCFLRLFCFFEMPYTLVVPSESIFPQVIDCLTSPILQLNILNISICLLNVFTSVWVIGIIYFLNRYIVHSICINKAICRDEGTNNSQILACMNELIDSSGKHTKVKVIQNKAITIPMIIGFFQPTIYLPDIPLTEKEIKNILLHEWTHFLNKDSWVKLFIYLISAVFWWNPFVHILSENLNHILEVRCDLKLTYKMNEAQRVEYLETIKKIIKYKVNLVSTPQYTKLAGISALISTNNMKKISQRFYLVLNVKYKKNQIITSIPLYLMILLLTLFSYMFVLQPSYEPTTTYNKPEIYEITPENAYLKPNNNNTYDLYADGKYRAIVDNINVEPFSSLPIK